MKKIGSLAMAVCAFLPWTFPSSGGQQHVRTLLIEATSEIHVQPNQVPYEAPLPHDLGKIQPQNEIPTNPTSNSTLEIAPPPVFEGCWEGQPNRVSIEQIGPGPKAESQLVAQKLRLCYRRVGHGLLQFTYGNVTVDLHENTVKNYSNHTRLLSSDGKTWVRLLSETEADETLKRFRFIPAGSIHLSTTAELSC